MPVHNHTKEIWRHGIAGPTFRVLRAAQRLDHYLCVIDTSHHRTGFVWMTDGLDLLFNVAEVTISRFSECNSSKANSRSRLDTNDVYAWKTRFELFDRRPWLVFQCYQLVKSPSEFNVSEDLRFNTWDTDNLYHIILTCLFNIQAICSQEQHYS